MNKLLKKRVLVGITGGIAAYKSAELVRQLRTAGADVRVVMTRAATQFITPLTLRALSGQPVYSDWAEVEAAMGHIELARWAQRILIAPASADSLARLAQGRADELLDALCLASEAPVMVAPAMNRLMWSNPATQHNVAVLLSRGFQMLGPASGEQACGETGLGRMLEADSLCQAVEDSFADDLLTGLRVLITAGPTREAIDPVRCLTNHSSGKTGYAIAEAARDAGAVVALVSGPVALDAPSEVLLTQVESAADMYAAVLARVADYDIFIATAAVADYRPVQVAQQKIKKQALTLQLQLEKTKDILVTVAKLADAPFCVGFAAETDQVEKNARKKRLSKSVDLIIANQVGAGLGFEADDNTWQLYWEGGSSQFTRAPKTQLARQLVEQVASLYRSRHRRLSRDRSRCEGKLV